MKILVADNDTVSRTYLMRTLTKMGHECVVAKNTDEFIGLYLDSAPPMIAIVVRSFIEVDSYKLVRVIRGLTFFERPHLIVVTSRDKTESIKDAITAGVDDFLTKPYAPSDLYQVLIRWLLPHHA